MRSYTQNKDGVGNSADSDHINRGLRQIEELQFYDSQTIKVEQTTRGTRFHAKIPPAAAAAGGYQGEYDPTKAYSVSQEFKVSVALTIAAHVVPVGIWAVRPASSVVDAQGFGPWAGYLPANPATSGIAMANLFFDPANPTTLGAAPNDILYAELKTPLCPA